MRCSYSSADSFGYSFARHPHSLAFLPLAPQNRNNVDYVIVMAYRAGYCCCRSPTRYRLLTPLNLLPPRVSGVSSAYYTRRVGLCPGGVMSYVKNEVGFCPGGVLSVPRATVHMVTGSILAKVTK